jgi:hypothetical protein
MKAPSRFLQIDIERALKGAKAAGFDSVEFLVSPSGDFRIIANKPEEDKRSSASVRQEIERHFGDAKT